MSGWKKWRLSNTWLLIIYAVLFATVVGSYESYQDNSYLVALAATVLLITGLWFWLWSIRNNLDK
jgi:undecaprenyl pyrophosphate phosphatase UppP